MVKKIIKIVVAFSVVVAMLVVAPTQVEATFTRSLTTGVTVFANGTRAAWGQSHMNNPAPNAIRGMRTRTALGNSLAHNGTALAQTTTARSVSSTVFRTGVGVTTTFFGMYQGQNSNGTWVWLNHIQRTVTP